MAESKPKKKKKKTKISPEEIEKGNHRKEIRSIFSKAGFIKVLSVSDKEFTFKGRTGDIDDVFIFENIIILAEYTCSKTENISDHLLKKKIIFDHITNNPSEFIEFFEEKFDSFKLARDDFFDPNQCFVKVVYCSKNSVSQRHKDQLTNIFYLDYSIVKYFKSVTDAIKLSSRFEIFKFFDLQDFQVGKESINLASRKGDLPGSLLPESHSNFAKGFKIVSFYIDPNSLLKKSYVLRKDSWRDEGGLYQRMIIGEKIKSIRKYLYTVKRVFINNIIVTLPSKTKLLNDNGDTINPSDLTKTVPVKIQIPEGFNVIGLIDGQHRVYAYHEGGEFDKEIEKLREKQNLLVTGIIYPENITEIEISKFEAQLFLEINSNQTNAKSDLKQAIGLILNPFSAESIAKAVIYRLNSSGPLEGQLERYYYDKDKIKTTSIVSYGLKPIVKLSGNDSFFSSWDYSQKNDLLNANNSEVLNRYIDFCTEELNKFFVAVKTNLSKEKWTTNQSVKNKVLSTSPINGLIITLRRLIEENKTGDIKYYQEKLQNIDAFDFSNYKSSQYGAMSRELYDRFFND